jgi:hypothetical protein
MEDGIVLHYPDGSCFLGQIQINDTELIFLEKNEKLKRISMMTEKITGPNALSRTAKIDKIRVDEIINAQRKRNRLNKNAYFVTLKNGTIYMMVFDHPKRTIEYLESVINKEEK